MEAVSFLLETLDPYRGGEGQRSVAALRLQQVSYCRKEHASAFDYDTDHSVQAVDVEIKISKAGSGFDPS